MRVAPSRLAPPHLTLPLLLALGACSSQAPTPDDSGTPPVEATDSPAVEAQASPALSLTSTAPAIRLAAVPEVPVHKGGASGQEFCSQFVKKPASAAARAVRDAGWAVTGEASQGGYELVSFAGAMEPGTSGTCTLEKGNLAFFKDGKIQAIAYGRKEDDLAIGLVEAGESGLRIRDGDVLHQNAAIISIGANGAIRIAPMPAKEAVCTGTAAVPKIQDLPIDKARTLLLKAGWNPRPRSEPVSQIEDGRAYDLVQQGVVEVDSCSGTGMAYCSFEYTGPAGDLSVTTVGDGEWPTVSDYGVTCKG
ncbi:hypothetical protein HT136_13110 [Novosphingobium profundi]|uniref:hypothetical protein n=1 Tax=Novosphingobium profundi TaxID=1774954 RepID=UPI001BDA4F89|nr:hypothetical protein [Novosphingobium profundi]MBT0669304.1 hypothetical protein [Novosphingobium profundi]